MQTVTPAKNYQIIVPTQVVPLVATYSPAVAVGQVNQIALYVDFTIGNLVSLDFSIQASYDGVNFYNKAVLDVANGIVLPALYVVPTYAGVFRLTANGSMVIDIPSCYQYVRFAYEGLDRDASNSSITVAIGSGSI